MRTTLLISILTLTTPALAQACPPQNKRVLEETLAPHFAALKKAKNPREAQEPSARIWDIWTRAPDAKAQAMLDVAVGQMRAGDLIGAREALKQLTRYCPDYAEGWNQLAFAKFLAGDYDGALEDLDRALQRAPNHFGAMAGRGMALLRQGKSDLGHAALRKALTLHPWMNERRLLPPEEKI